LSLIADSASQTPSTVAFPKNGPVDELNRLQRSLERLRVSLLVAMNLANKP
jgi:HAMP domain-containing protein